METSTKQTVMTVAILLNV